MKTKIILFIIFFTFCQGIFSQHEKTIYVNEDLDILSKQEFHQNPLKKTFFVYTFESDSSLVKVKIFYKKNGRISKIKNKEIRSYLSEISNSKIDSINTIVINYFPFQGKCLGKRKWNFRFKKKYNNYIKEIHKLNQVSQFLIFQGENKMKNFTWFQDKKQIIEKTFFKFPPPCFSYVIIRPNGNYLSTRGEYDITSIPYILK